jgi:hypothetical protein
MCDFEKNCPKFRDVRTRQPFRTVKHAASRENALTGDLAGLTSALT